MHCLGLGKCPSKHPYFLQLFAGSSVAFLIFTFRPDLVYEAFLEENSLELILLLIPIGVSSVPLQPFPWIVGESRLFARVRGRGIRAIPANMALLATVTTVRCCCLQAPRMHGCCHARVLASTVFVVGEARACQGRLSSS